MNTESRAPIDFYFDFSSPYSYIANEWIDALAARHGRVVRRRAILLGVAFQAAELKSPVSHPIKRDYALRDFARSARFEGLPYLMPSTFPIPTQNAARVFWWLQETQGAEAAAAWTRSAFRAFFTRDIVLSDPAALKALLAESGNLLMMDGRAVDKDQWMAMSRAMVDAGVGVVRAANAKQAKSLIAARARLNATCENCHKAYKK